MTAGASVWVQAARPVTLPAAIAPVLVGTAAAEAFVAWRMAAALAVGLAFQIGVNFANDYFDGVRGVDTEQRTGPQRAVATGQVAPSAMRAAMGVAFAVALLAGLALAVAVGWELVLVGLACLFAALGYSGGPRPYASAGLGEVFVFATFGLVATAGSAYVQDAGFAAGIWPAATAMGLLASALLMVNNIRDVPTDAHVGKRTLAVRLGDRTARRAYVALVVVAFTMLPLIVVARSGPAPFVALLAAPLAVSPVRRVLAGHAGADLVDALRATGRVHLAFGVLLGLGFVFSP